MRKNQLKSTPSFVLILGIPLLFMFQAKGQNLKTTDFPVKIEMSSDFGLNTIPYKNDPRAKKISGTLMALVNEMTSGKNMSNVQGFKIEGKYILIEAYAKSESMATQLLESLEKMGLQNGSKYKHIINGMLPYDKIDKTMELQTMRYLEVVYKPSVNVGLVTGEGGQSMRTTDFRAATGGDGSGLKIGVLSDTYNALGGAAASVANGDLPGSGNPNGYTTPVQVLSDLAVGSDEGRAMAELIHDVAPGATMAFHTAFAGIADFASGILELRQAGCDIIVDDVSYFAQPYFQDDIISQAANEVVEDGAMFFSSAANARNNSYENAFNPGGFLYNFGSGLVYEPHDWGGGDYFLQITLPPGAGLNLWLQWDDPSILAGLAGANRDLDVLVFNSTLTSIIAASVADNIFSGTPVEVIQTGNGGGAPLVINLFVGRFAPAPGNPAKIKFIDFRSGNIGQYFQNSAEWNKSTIVGHHNALRAMSVGAAAYFNTPAFGINPPLINDFSSVGGTSILMDTDGNYLASPELRYKPDFTGPDGANNSFFGGDFEPDGFPNFFGTSAAAPHAAAMAALLLEKFPFLSNSAVEHLMKSTAIDMNDPRGVHSNLNGTTFDFATGYGLINASAALESIPTMGQWALIVLALLSMICGVLVLKSYEKSRIKL